MPKTYAQTIEVVLVNTAGGLTGGDEFEVRLGAEGDTHLTVSTQTAERVYRALGPQNADEALVSLDLGNVARAIEIVLAYYDKTYMKAANAMPRKVMPSLKIDELDDSEIAASAIALSNNATFV